MRRLREFGWRVRASSAGRPPRPATRAVPVIVALALALGLARPAAAAAPATVDAALLTAPPREEWLSYGRTPDEGRFSPLDQLTADGVAKLGLAWYVDLGTSRGVEATPLFADGVLYATLPWSDAVAVDARTGKELWRYDAKVPRERGQKACCDVVNRGMAMYHGKLYLATLDGRLVALDAVTGKPVFQVQTFDAALPYTITAAPRVMNGKVLIGNGGAEYGVRGYVTAYDAETGKQVWRFYTVPGDPSKPFESKALATAAKSWSGEWWKYGGGGTAWDAMAYDPALHLAYFGTGNGSTWSRYIRSPKGGDNLYLCSILAVDVDTGELKWSFQNTPGDTWDYDSTQHLILADLTIDGAPRQVVMQANKNGFFYVIDRKTGQFISGAPFVKVNWATGLDAASGRPIESPEGQWKDKAALVYPAPIGAHNWQPMSYNPQTGLVYIPVTEAGSPFTADDKFEYHPGDWNTGANFAVLNDAPPEALQGGLLAWDPVKGKGAWRVPLWGHWNGGTLTTAGNLVFQGTGNGKLAAYRADTGAKLWEAPAGTGIIAAPMTYMLDGQQYVTVMAGWGGVGGLMYGRAAKAAGVVSIGRMLTFKVGGDAQLPPPPQEVASEPPPLINASLNYIKGGEILFHTHCSVCHGLGAVGGGVVPDLRHVPPEIHAQWDEIVLKGALKDQGMISMANYVTKAQSDAIRAYVIYRAHEGDTPKPIDVKPVMP